MQAAGLHFLPFWVHPPPHKSLVFGEQSWGLRTVAYSEWPQALMGLELCIRERGELPSEKDNGDKKKH